MSKFHLRATNLFSFYDSYNIIRNINSGVGTIVEFPDRFGKLAVGKYGVSVFHFAKGKISRR